MGATVWLVQQWNAGTRIALLDKPDSGTQGGFAFYISKELVQRFASTIVVE